MTKEEWKGLKALTENPHITIKKAYKGSAVVVMNTTDYLREGYRQLQDKPGYIQKLLVIFFRNVVKFWSCGRT